MALCAIGDGMAQGQRKKTVIHLVCIPVDLVDVMALRTIGGEVVFDMVRAAGRLKVLQVAIHTVIADPVKAEASFGTMAVKATDCGMGTDQGEAIVKMDLGNVVDEPVVGRMTPGTILADGLLVNVGMAGNAFCACIRKDHGRVATPAVDQGMLTLQVKSCGFMLEGHVLTQGLPAGRGMAIGTIDGKLLAVR